MVALMIAAIMPEPRWMPSWGNSHPPRRLLLFRWPGRQSSRTRCLARSGQPTIPQWGRPREWQGDFRSTYTLPAKYRIVDGLENGQHRPYYEAEVEDRLCKIERARIALTGPGRASVRAPDPASRRLGRAPLRFANRSPAREARPNFYTQATGTAVRIKYFYRVEVRSVW